MFISRIHNEAICIYQQQTTAREFSGNLCATGIISPCFICVSQRNKACQQKSLEKFTSKFIRAQFPAVHILELSDFRQLVPLVNKWTSRNSRKWKKKHKTKARKKTSQAVLQNYHSDLLWPFQTVGKKIPQFPLWQKFKGNFTTGGLKTKQTYNF